MILGTYRSVAGVALTVLMATALWASPEPPRPLSDLQRPIGEINDSEFSPDGQWLLFVQDARFRGVRDIYALPVTGEPSDIVKLGEQRGRTLNLQFSADGSTFFFVDAEGAVASVPLTGGPATKLYEPPSGVGIGWLRATTDGNLVFTMERPLDEIQVVMTVPATGGPANEIAEMPTDRWRISGLAVTADGSRVVYGGAISLQTVIFSVPSAGGATTIISHQPQPGEWLRGFSISPDDSRVIYRLTATVANIEEIRQDDLYSVPVAGGAPAVLIHDGYDGSTSAGTFIDFGTNHFFFTQDGRLLFADHTVNDSHLYLSDLDGGGKTLLDSPASIFEFWWLPEQDRLFYQRETPNYAISTRQLEVGPAQILSDHAGGNLVPRISAVAADGQHVAYGAFVQTGQRVDAYGVATAGGPPVLLNDPTASPESIDAIAATHERAVFARDSRLVSVAFGGGPELFVTEPYLDRDRFGQGDVFPDGSSVKLEAKYTGAEAEELFRVPLDGGESERWSPATVEVTGTVEDHIQSAGGQFVFYSADRDSSGRLQLYRSDIGGAAPVNPAVGPPLEGLDRIIDGPTLAAASNTAIFEVRRDGQRELWSKTFAGELRKLTDVSPFGLRYEIVQPGHVLLYLDGGDLKEITLATGAERLLEDLEMVIEDFSVSRDGSTVLLETDGTAHSLPIAGGTPTDLGTTLTEGQISPDGAWALFRVGVGDSYRLFSTDGLEERLLGDVGFGLGFTGDSRFLVFVTSTSLGELHSYEIATELETHLDAGVVRPAGFSRVGWIHVNQHDVIFYFSGSFSSRRSLYRVSATGANLQPLLDSPVEELEYRDLDLSPDGSFAVLGVPTAEDFFQRHRYLASTRETNTRLLEEGAPVEILGFSPDSSLVFYQSQSPSYQAPLKASSTTGGRSFALTPADFGDVQPGLIFSPTGTMTMRVRRHDERLDLYALEIGDFILFADGFERGDLSAWDGFVP